jgi:Domain of unknown function (DUF4259)
MGTWGPGNFENDTAADHLMDLCRPLLGEIEEAMEEPVSLQPDQDDADIVMANLEVIACLSEHLGRYEHSKLGKILYPCVLPFPEKVAKWKQGYLALWDGYIDELEPAPDYKKKRREVIVETFDRLERLARAQQKD